MSTEEKGLTFALIEAEKVIADLKYKLSYESANTELAYSELNIANDSIKELAEALKEAADDIVDYANYYNNDSTVVVTEAHDEADKYRALANKHLKGEQK